ncbi:hypothetical protein ACP275_07G063100 [Erythranthe tilingii]
MEKINISLFLIFFLVGVAHSKSIGHKQVGNWCVAQANAPDDKMQGFLDYACGVTDCAAIQSGGPCYDANNIFTHVDYALNQVYKTKGTCNTEIGMIVTVDPSFGSCKFQ